MNIVKLQDKKLTHKSLAFLYTEKKKEKFRKQFHSPLQ